MTTDNHALDQARAQYASIAAMVAAVDMDWDRLAELRDERESSDTPSRALANNPDHTGGWWEDENPDDAQELAELEVTAGDYKSREQADIAIAEDALSLQFRSGWHSFGEELTPAEFEILLCTGGPAVRIVGDVNEHGDPERPRLQYQDWGTPWTEYFGEELDRDVLLSYCSHYVAS